jgi:hypothetical protein
MLAEDAIKSAISNYYTKNPKAAQTDLGGTGASMPRIEIEKVSADDPATALVDCGELRTKTNCIL